VSFDDAMADALAPRVTPPVAPQPDEPPADASDAPAMSVTANEIQQAVATALAERDGNSKFVARVALGTVVSLGVLIAVFFGFGTASNAKDKADAKVGCEEIQAQARAAGPEMYDYSDRYLGADRREINRLTAEILSECRDKGLISR
jgi:hypothetical protein